MERNNVKVGGGEGMNICRKCKKKLVGWGYVIHHGNYHYKCLKEKYPDAEGEDGDPMVILMAKERNSE